MRFQLDSPRETNKWGDIGKTIAFIVLSLFIGGLRSGSARASSNTCMPDLPLVDSHGQPFDPASLKGKAILVDFVHTSCPGVCLTLTGKFSDVASKLGPELGSNVVLLSITNDPAHDGPKQLLQMAKKHGADKIGWLFLTGKPQDVDKFLAVFDLKSGLEPDGEPAHIPQVFLVGTDGCRMHDYNGMVMRPDKVTADLRRAASSSSQAAR
jgi:protein SCO1